MLVCCPTNTNANYGSKNGISGDNGANDIRM